MREGWIVWHKNRRMLSQMADKHRKREKRRGRQRRKQKEIERLSRFRTKSSYMVFTNEGKSGRHIPGFVNGKTNIGARTEP